MVAVEWHDPSSMFQPRMGRYTHGKPIIVHLVVTRERGPGAEGGIEGVLRKGEGCTEWRALHPRVAGRTPFFRVCSAGVESWLGTSPSTGSSGRNGYVSFGRSEHVVRGRVMWVSFARQSG